ncbi:hypothetical protein [Streptomyces cinnamoneus]|uniref:hypothetical protein n=1 Tax=Streptomyces cinnamoneus TaxID=53446 RepID=UPI00379B856D
MTGWRRSGRRAACCLTAVVLGVQALTGCDVSGGGDRGDHGRAAAERLLKRWSAAVRDRDESAYLAAVDPAAEGYRAERRRVFASLASVPLASWEYRLVRTGGFAPAAGDGRRLAAQVELRYRLAGYDSAPVSTALRLTLVRRDGGWYVAGQDAGGGGAQLWEQGEVTVVRGRRGIVLGVGQDPQRLRAVADLVDRAVPDVDGAWRGPWAERVVVEMPASLDRMAALLGAPAANYRGIAAVTTGEVGGGPAAPADRIIVNPEAYGALGDFGRRIVLTHETAHVATRARTSAATPLWLSEGFADWAAYRATGRTARQAAPELAAALEAGSAPRELPEDADFGFTGEAGRLARAYEGGWLACRMIAERWGEERLVAFYAAVGARKKRAGAVDGALREVLGVSAGEFTQQWRRYVTDAF